MPTELPSHRPDRNETSSLPGAGIVAAVSFATLVTVVVFILMMPR